MWADLRQHHATAALAAVALVLGWPSRVLQAADGIDPSWIMGLHLAGDAGLHLGQDVVFTFGPLGSLTRPVNLDTWALLPGLALRLVAMGVIALLVAHHTQRLFGRLGGAVATIALVGLLVGPYGRGADPELLLALAVVGLVALLRRHVALWHIPVGLVGAVLLLAAKVSAGFTALVLWAVFAAATWARATTGERAGLARPAVAGVVGSVVLLALLGFTPSGFVSYLANGLDLTLGFAAGMHDSHPRTVLHLVAFLLVALVVASVGWTTLRRAEDRQARIAAAGIVVLLALFTWTRLKYGFTREGPGHLIPAVGGLVLVALPLLPAAPADRDGADGHRDRSLAAGAVLAMLVALVVVIEPALARPSQIFEPVVSTRAFASDVLSAVSRAERLEDRILARQELVDSLGIGPEVAPPPGTLHVDPWDISAVWALDRVDDWRPPPVFQSYSAYTPGLDRQNAEHFLGPDRPDWVLRRPRMIDNRNPAWDPPRHLLALACGWDQVAGGGKDWSLLRHRDAARCDALASPAVQSSVSTTLGEWVTVPGTSCQGQPTVMTLEPQHDGLLGRVRTLAWVPPVWTVEARLADGRTTHWRWLPAFAGEPMLLAMPEDPATGPVTWPLLGSSSQIAELRLVRADDVLQSGDGLTVTFGCQP